jgi:spore maturation protein A
MLNALWLILLVGSTVVAICTGHVKELVLAVTDSANSAFKLALGLTGVMALWLGIMRIAQDSGLVDKLTRLITPLMRWLFPQVPDQHPSHATMAMNIAANMCGLNNAATPLGIKAMEDLETLNPRKGVATDAMCMFLAINTSSVQLIPVNAIALLAAGGSSDPTAIVLPAILATMVSTFVGVASARILAKCRWFSLK